MFNWFKKLFKKNKEIDIWEYELEDDENEYYLKLEECADKDLSEAIEAFVGPDYNDFMYKMQKVDSDKATDEFFDELEAAMDIKDMFSPKKIAALLVMHTINTIREQIEKENKKLAKKNKAKTLNKKQPLKETKAPVKKSSSPKKKSRTSKSQR